MQRTLTFQISITETLHTSTAPFLPRPAISLHSLVSSVCKLISSKPDACFRLADGEVYAHEELLCKNEHFQSLLDAGFIESQPRQGEQVDAPEEQAHEIENADDTVSSATVEVPHEMETDSDFGAEQTVMETAPRRTAGLKVVSLPHFR